MNLTSDADQDFFADGMTEELTTDLGKISALRLISRTSAMQYKGNQEALARDRAGIRCGRGGRGNRSLVGQPSSDHREPSSSVLWAENYESEVGDALTVQGEIAQAVAREIQVKLTSQEQHLLTVARPVNPEAQDLYLRGLYTMRGMESAGSSEKAVKYFRRPSRRTRTIRQLTTLCREFIR